MQTIEINDEQYPVERLEGCPDFDSWDGDDLYFQVSDLKKQSWASLSDWQKRHAACVASMWYRRRSRLDYFKGLDHAKAELESAAEKWGELANSLWEA